MTEQRFQETGFRMTYAEFSACDCTKCSRENCPHRDAFRRFPLRRPWPGRLTPNADTPAGPHRRKAAPPHRPARRASFQKNNMEV